MSIQRYYCSHSRSAELSLTRSSDLLLLQQSLTTFLFAAPQRGSSSYTSAMQ